jgi:hypothetical protein
VCVYVCVWRGRGGDDSDLANQKKIKKERAQREKPPWCMQRSAQILQRGQRVISSQQQAQSYVESKGM